MQACPSGTYGANCSNVCACGTGASHCDAITGCVCMTGWTGDKCHRDVNECDVESTRQQCESKGARCVNFQGGFRCQCDQGYTMDNDTSCQGNEYYLQCIEYIVTYFGRMPCKITTRDSTKFRLEP